MNKKHTAEHCKKCKYHRRLGTGGNLKGCHYGLDHNTVRGVDPKDCEFWKDEKTDKNRK